MNFEITHNSHGMSRGVLKISLQEIADGFLKSDSMYICEFLIKSVEQFIKPFKYDSEDDYSVYAFTDWFVWTYTTSSFREQWCSLMGTKSENAYFEFWNDGTEFEFDINLQPFRKMVGREYRNFVLSKVAAEKQYDFEIEVALMEDVVAIGVQLEMKDD